MGQVREKLTQISTLATERLVAETTPKIPSNGSPTSTDSSTSTCTLREEDSTENLSSFINEGDAKFGDTRKENILKVEKLTKENEKDASAAHKEVVLPSKDKYGDYLKEKTKKIENINGREESSSPVGSRCEEPEKMLLSKEISSEERVKKYVLKGSEEKVEVQIHGIGKDRYKTSLYNETTVDGIRNIISRSARTSRTNSRNNSFEARDFKTDIASRLQTDVTKSTTSKSQVDLSRRRDVSGDLPKSKETFSDSYKSSSFQGTEDYTTCSATIGRYSSRSSETTHTINEISTNTRKYEPSRGQYKSVTLDRLNKRENKFSQDVDSLGRRYQGRDRPYRSYNRERIKDKEVTSLDDASKSVTAASKADSDVSKTDTAASKADSDVSKTDSASSKADSDVFKTDSAASKADNTVSKADTDTAASKTDSVVSKIDGSASKADGAVSEADSVVLRSESVSSERHYSSSSRKHRSRPKTPEPESHPVTDTKLFQSPERRTRRKSEGMKPLPRDVLNNFQKSDTLHEEDEACSSDESVTPTHESANVNDNDPLESEGSGLDHSRDFSPEKSKSHSSENVRLNVNSSSTPHLTASSSTNNSPSGNSMNSKHQNNACSSDSSFNESSNRVSGTSSPSELIQSSVTNPTTGLSTATPTSVPAEGASSLKGKRQNLHEKEQPSTKLTATKSSSPISNRRASSKYASCTANAFTDANSPFTAEETRPYTSVLRRTSDSTKKDSASARTISSLTRTPIDRAWRDESTSGSYSHRLSAPIRGRMLETGEKTGQTPLKSTDSSPNQSKEEKPYKKVDASSEGGSRTISPTIQRKSYSNSNAPSKVYPTSTSYTRHSSKDKGGGLELDLKSCDNTQPPSTHSSSIQNLMSIVRSPVRKSPPSARRKYVKREESLIFKTDDPNSSSEKELNIPSHSIIDLEGPEIVIRSAIISETKKQNAPEDGPSNINDRLKPPLSDDVRQKSPVSDGVRQKSPVPDSIRQKSPVPDSIEHSIRQNSPVPDSIEQNSPVCDSDSNGEKSSVSDNVHVRLRTRRSTNSRASWRQTPVISPDVIEMVLKGEIFDSDDEETSENPNYRKKVLEVCMEEEEEETHFRRFSPTSSRSTSRTGSQTPILKSSKQTSPDLTSNNTTPTEKKVSINSELLVGEESSLAGPRRKYLSPDQKSMSSYSPEKTTPPNERGDSSSPDPFSISVDSRSCAFSRLRVTSLSHSTSTPDLTEITGQAKRGASKAKRVERSNSKRLLGRSRVDTYISSPSGDIPPSPARRSGSITYSPKHSSTSLTSRILTGTGINRALSRPFSRRSEKDASERNKDRTLK